MKPTKDHLVKSVTGKLKSKFHEKTNSETAFVPMNNYPGNG